MLILLRHGETEFNRARRWQGQIDSPLTDRGRRQAAAAAEKLLSADITGIITSPLGRARETASIVAAALQQAVREDSRLMEVGSGVCEGLTHEQIEKRWPGFIAWRAIDRWNRAPEGGETYGDARLRLMEFAAETKLADIVDSDGQALLLVAHSRSLAILAGTLLGWPDARTVETYPVNSTPLVLRNGNLEPL